MAPSGTQDRRSDAELVAACNDGDAAEATAAFASLYRRHRDYVLRVAFRFVADHDLALDALQETFAWLLRRFPPAGPGLELTAKFTTFLYPVAKNSALTARRKAERAQGAGDVAPDELPSAATAAAGDDVERLLAGLPEERREVVLLRLVDDLSLQEIADALGIPLGTVKSRLHLAIGQLRESPAVKNLCDP